MKKIVIIICVISIILTSAVFSVSAAEAKNIEKEVQTETTTVELEIVPESEPTETTPNADTVPTIKETDETKIVEPKPERIGDSSYYGSFWGEPKTYIEIAPEDRKTREDLPADVQERLAAKEAEIEKTKQENVQEWVENRPLWSVDYRKDMDKYITSKVHMAAEAVVVAEIAALTKVGIDEVPLSITSEGKIVSETKIALPEEAIRKLATLYYEAYDLYQKATYGETVYMYQDFILLSCKYIAEDEVWIAYFRTDTEKYPERDRAHCRVVLKSNGEFVGLGR